MGREGCFAEEWGSIGFSMFSVCGVGEGAVLSVYCQYVGVFRGNFWRIWGGCGEEGVGWGGGGGCAVGSFVVGIGVGLH